MSALWPVVNQSKAMPSRRKREEQVSVIGTDTDFKSPGIAIWFTGLPSSGKTTLARHTQRALKPFYKVELLDGDELRNTLCRNLSYTKEDRDENIQRIGFVLGLLCQHGIICIVAAISPYRNARNNVRQHVPHFVEVYVNAPLAVCERRDVKGLYRKARQGHLNHLTGVDDPYETPLQPDVECCTDCEDEHRSTGKVLAFLEKQYGLALPCAQEFSLNV